MHFIHDIKFRYEEGTCAMKKLRIDILSILLFALLVMGAIVLWGTSAGIKTAEVRSRWLSGVALFALVFAVIASLDRLSRWSDRVHALIKRLAQTEMSGTTQGSLLAAKNPAKTSTKNLDRLRDALRYEHGLRWRYRQPWLLLTGDNATIERLLPELAEHGWLISQDAVLLWNKTDPDGRPDTHWLKQLYKLRRRRPVDAIILTLDGSAELSMQRRSTGAHGVNLARIADALYWAAPVFVLDVAQTDRYRTGDTPVIGCEFPRNAESQTIEAALLTLRNQLAHRSVAQLVHYGGDRYGAELSQRLDTRSAPLAQWIAALSPVKQGRAGRGLHNHQRISGAYFAPYPLPNRQAEQHEPGSAELPLWRHLGAVARTERGRRLSGHPLTVGGLLALTVVGVWTAGMLISGVSNAHDLLESQQIIHRLDTAPDAAARLHALLRLQQEIDHYEYRTQHHAPILSRFGLNRDTAVLAALWRPYTQASRRDLITPVQHTLEAQLVDLGQMQTGQVDSQTNALALEGHDTLKTYLMLADPQRADAGFMTPHLTQDWRTPAKLSVGEQGDIAERLLGFYAQHLKAHPDWRIAPRPELVGAARQTLLALIGVRNSEETIYQGVLDSVGNQYPNQTLMSLTAGTDPRGLIRSTASVPGAFTRQAYDGRIAAAIEEAAQRSDVAGDWVLAQDTSRDETHASLRQSSDKGSNNSINSSSINNSSAALKAALTRRYFADYADHWQALMNGLQWEPAPTLPAAIEQLKLMADARQSPVIALMKSLEYQGGAGARQDSLADTLVAKAQNVFSSKTAAPELLKPDRAGPLGATFGPVLRLVAQDPSGSHAAVSNSDLSEQRYLERVTSLRLKLQQISNSRDADAQARQVAQALFQGKGSELAETQNYAQLIAASLGEQWAGLGDALFVRPVAQAIHTVLQPAQASLNDAWRHTIVATWNRSFEGRYPFAHTANDASLPELARFLRPQGGLISDFLNAQLAGVLELQGDQWVPAATGNQTLRFDPAFLAAVNTLQRIAGHLLVQGEPAYRFEFKPIPTPGITDTVLTLDGQKLHYFNQRETWQALSWPSNTPQDEGTRLQWQTEQAGTNKNFEFSGRWGLVRMLEQARVEPIDDATYQLTWQSAPDTQAAMPGMAPFGDQDDAGSGHGNDAESLNPHGPRTAASPDLTYPLSYMMRTEVGQGPLELLALRGFVLPAQIFVGQGQGVAPDAKRTTTSTTQTEDPPPVPRAMLDTLKHAEISLPQDPIPP